MIMIYDTFLLIVHESKIVQIKNYVCGPFETASTFAWRQNIPTKLLHVK